MKQLVILAGGKGTRLKDRLNGLPKPLIDVCGVPLLERQIILAKHYQITDVLILVNYRAEAIKEFCDSRNNWGLQISCLDDGEPCGTAGAVLKAYNQLDEDFLLMYGDTMLDVDLSRFIGFHGQDPEAACTLFLHPNDHPHDSDLVGVNERGEITEFFPYPHDPSRYYPNLVNAALYCIRRNHLTPWRSTHDGIFDFGKNLFPLMLTAQKKLKAYISPEYIKDCGTPKRIDRVCDDFLSGKISRARLDHKQTAVFVDRDGTINSEVNHLSSPAQLKLLPGVSEGIARLNASEFKVIVVTNQPVVARGECSTGELRQIHNKLETQLGYSGSYVDKIYYCPHHPDSGFEGEVRDLKIECDCRKPNTGMIKSGISDFNIDVDRSWMIGDSTSDMLAGTRANLRTILVETGYGGRDEKFPVIPDTIVPSFGAAVDFVTKIAPSMTRFLAERLSTVTAGSLLFVGGNSRSGKSTYASSIRHFLKTKGLHSKIIATDRFLLPAERRTEGVLGRHDISLLKSVVEGLSDPRSMPVEILLPFYKKSTRTNYNSSERLEISPNDVVIIEGVVALFLAQLTSNKNVYFVEIDENERRKRVLQEYRLRGKTELEAEEIYASRLRDEKRWIDATSVDALLLPAPTAFLNRLN